MEDRHLAGQLAPVDPRGRPECKQEPHKDHVKLVTWNQTALLMHKLTGEVVVLAGTGACLDFDAAGFGYVTYANGDQSWVKSLLQYHVFTVTDGVQQRQCVFQMNDTGVRNEWLDDFVQQRKLLQTDLPSQRQEPVSILQTIPKLGNPRYFWRLVTLTKQTRQQLMLKLRSQWIPAFKSRFGLETTAGHVLWPPGCKVTKEHENLWAAHDVFVSTVFVVFLLCHTAFFRQGAEESMSLMENLLQPLLPEKARLRIGGEANLAVRLREGNVELSEVTSRTAFKARMNSSQPLPMKFRQKQSVWKVVVGLWRRSGVSWVVADLLSSLAAEVELGVASRNFPTDPSAAAVLNTDHADTRDPAVLLARTRAALEKARAARGEKKKKMKMTSSDKISLRVAAVKCRSLIRSRQRRQERFQYLQTCRRSFQNCRALHLSFDGSRVGGRKRVFYALLDAHSGLSAWAPPLALKDSQYRAATDVPEADEQARLDKLTIQFLASHRARDQKVAREDLAPVVKKKQRLPSLEQLVGLEQTLETMLANRPSLLCFKGANPEAMAALEEPVLCITADAGPDVQSSLQYLLNHVRLNLIHHWDPRHRLAREQANGASRSKMVSVLTLAELLINFGRGPWAGYKWYRRLQEELVDYAATLDAAPELEREGGGMLFKTMAAEIARQQDLREEDLTPAKLRELLRDSNFMKRHGPSSTNRWNSFHVGWAQRRPELGLLKLVTVSYGLKAGYLKPATNKAAAAAQQQFAAGRESNAEDQPETLKGETKASLFQKCTNKMHVATEILLQPQYTSRINAWFQLTLPMSQELERVRTMLQGRQGTLEHLLSEGRGAGFSVVTQILQAVQDPQTFDDIGVWHGGRLGSLHAVRLRLEDPEVRLQDQSCQFVFEVALSLVQAKMEHVVVQVFNWPDCLVMFLGTEAEQNRALVDLHVAREAHNFAKANTLKSKWLRVFGNRSPLNCRVMENVLCHLDKHQWTITKRLQQFVQECFSGLGGTWNEEAFGRARQLEDRENKSHEMAGVEAWQCCSFSNTLHSFGFEEVKTDATTCASEKLLPASVFHLLKREAPEALKRITQNATWPSLTQQSISTTACELVLLQDALKSNKVSQLSDTWRSSFLVKGLVVQHDSFEPSKMYLSLGSCHTSASVILLQLESSGNAGLDLCPIHRDSIKIAQVFKFEGWYVVPAQMVSPLHHQLVSGSTQQRIPFLLKTGEKVPLLKHVASEGYYNLDEKRLTLLLKEEFGEAPAAEAQLGEMLQMSIQKGLKINAAQAADVMEGGLKHRLSHTDDEEFVEMLNMEHFQDLLSAETAKDVANAINAAKASQQVVMSITASIRGARGQPKKQMKELKRKPVSFQPRGDYHVEQVSRWAPPRCRVYKDMFNGCWRCYDRFGSSVSRSWGASGGEGVAIKKMLSKSWEKYVALNPGEHCPWDFK